MITQLIKLAQALETRGYSAHAELIKKLADEPEKKEINWKEFVVNNLFKLEGSDYEDPEELWQEEDLIISEYFGGMMERAEMESGISCPVSLSKNLLNALNEIKDNKEAAALSEAENGLMSFLKQYLNWNLEG